MTTPITADLRAWARGSYPIEAATELLIRAFRGRFAQPGHPWIRHDSRHWIAFDAITDETTAVYSGGERRVLALAAALGGHREVNLMETVSGLDRSVLMLVLAAIAHAAGSHQHADLRFNPATGAAHLIVLGSLFPWPHDGATHAVPTERTVSRRDAADDTANPELLLGHGEIDNRLARIHGAEPGEQFQALDRNE